MSVSMWSYIPEVCDGGGCPGDCDLCDKPKNMEDELTNSTQRVKRRVKNELNAMTDYIKRDAVSDYLESNNMPWCEWVKDIPSADVVEVVRCKDCKWHFQHWNIVGCNHDNMSEATIGYSDDYCSYGERIEA